MGCLSALDYLGAPRSREIHKLKLLAKNALGLAMGAPEIVYNALSRSTIDPASRWLVSLVRLWHQTTRSEDALPILEDPSGPPQSRFATLKKERKNLGRTLNSNALTTPFADVAVLDKTSSYTYCGRCYIARRLRDAHFLYVKQCAKQEEKVAVEGDCKIVNGHCVRVKMDTWRRAALRPKMACVFCRVAWWASSPRPFSPCAVGFPP